MLIKFKQDKVRETPPGLAAPYFVEFCTLNRPQRDQARYCIISGQAAELADALLTHGISDFLLPSDQGDISYRELAQQGKGPMTAEVYASLDDELADWCCQRIIEFNALMPAGRERVEVVLGNSDEQCSDSLTDSESET